MKEIDRYQLEAVLVALADWLDAHRDYEDAMHRSPLRYRIEKAEDRRNRMVTEVGKALLRLMENGHA